MHILVVYNAVDTDARADDLDVLAQVEAVSEALRRSGHAVDALPISLNLTDLKAAVASIRPDVAFNLVESLDGRDRLAPLAPWLLEALDCPYTGASAASLTLLADKVRAKERLRWAGLPTPAWIVPGAQAPCDSRGKAGGPTCMTAAQALTKGLAASGNQTAYIIKPIHDHGSFGIGTESILRTDSREHVLTALAERERRLARPCFAERFIDGREFNLSVLAGPGGPEVLPPAEILFVEFPVEEPRIVNYAAKWEPESFAYRNTPRRFDFCDSDRSLLRELRQLAAACWHLFGLRGYTRVDFRVDADGRPWILEVNANPCLAPDAGFAAAVERAGYSFAEAIERIVADALVGNRRNDGVRSSVQTEEVPAEPASAAPLPA